MSVIFAVPRRCGRRIVQAIWYCVRPAGVAQPVTCGQARFLRRPLLPQAVGDAALRIKGIAVRLARKDGARKKTGRRQADVVSRSPDKTPTHPFTERCLKNHLIGGRDPDAQVPLSGNSERRPATDCSGPTIPQTGDGDCRRSSIPSKGHPAEAAVRNACARPRANSMRKDAPSRPILPTPRRSARRLPLLCACAQQHRAAVTC